MDSAEHNLQRWQAAGLLSAETADAIRAYELAGAKPAGRQWQVLLALILGAILLGAGVLLFVAAHWDSVGPIDRLCLVLSMLVFFHGMGLLSRERFSGFATAMHAVGTVSAGAAIALVGQIFNMQEHWPSAVLLWALCAGAGWWLLRDEFQQTLTLLLLPAWIISEWGDRTDAYGGFEVYLGRICLVIGSLYLTAFLHERRRAVFGILFTVGLMLCVYSVIALSDGWSRVGFTHEWGFIHVSYRILAFGIIAIAVGIAAVSKGLQSAVPAGIALVLGLALPWAQVVKTETSFGNTWTRSEPSLLAYALVAAFAVFLVAWGVRGNAKALVNAGVVGFALTVTWFYFSSIMDKLGRSLGLITLGILFLAGGWALEVTRRKLLGSMTAGEA